VRWLLLLVAACAATVAPPAARLPADGRLVDPGAAPFVAAERYRGKVVVLDFWAGWCDECKRTVPQVARLAAAFAGQGLVVIGVNAGEAPEAARTAARTFAIDYPIALDPELAFSDRLGPAACLFWWSSIAPAPSSTAPATSIRRRSTSSAGCSPHPDRVRSRPMFEAAEIGQNVEKEAYDSEVAVLRDKLLAAQQELRRANFPVIVVVGGVDGAGKGETVNTLLEWLDPRYVETYSHAIPTEEDLQRPPFWRFWRALPARGKMGIFFGGWHSAPIVDRVYRRIKDSELERQLAEVVALERLLVADGALLVKFWMHLSKERQYKRLRSLEKDKLTRWRVTHGDWERYELYDRFSKISAQALRRTSTGEAPWSIIDSAHRRFQILSVGRILLERLETQLAAHATPAPKPAPPPPPPPITGATIVSTLDLGQALDKPEYDERLEACQGELNQLCRRAAKAKLATVIVFEGVDAAGKGGSIRRVTSALDARMYHIVPIAAPTEEERAHPYLWRFWRKIPRAGELTIFDRSWYGRVLVERVEGFCSTADWMRAYSEINDFEEQLAHSGIVVVKFWLQISKDEQLHRFEQRADTSWKRFKITDEDWRNREKWDAYETAVNDMVERTSTEHAPWTLVESNSKYFARIKTLETLNKAIKSAL
jgi:AMP-polyphosphate phosphotransferase